MVAEALAQQVFDKFELGRESAMNQVRNASAWILRIAAASIALSGSELSAREMAQAQWVLAYNLTAHAGRVFLHVDLRALATRSRASGRDHSPPALLSAPRVSVPSTSGGSHRHGRRLDAPAPSRSSCGPGVRRRSARIHRLRFAGWSGLEGGDRRGTKRSHAAGVAAERAVDRSQIKAATEP